MDLSTLPYEQIWAEQINLSYVINAYQCVMSGDSVPARFFTAFFDKLMGQTYVREMIEAGADNAAIRQRWQDDVKAFVEQRKPYLLYEE